MRAVPQPGPLRLASAPHADTFGYSMPPPGLLRLGGWLERDGWRVELDDLAHRVASGALPSDERIVDACAERLLAGGAPWVLGLSVMGATLPVALAILERVRARAPRAVLALGGPGTTGIDAALVERFAFLDAVVRGEGEETAGEWLARLAEGAPLDGTRGLTWRDGAGGVRREPDRPPLADLERLAPPAWHLLPPLAAYKAVTGEEDGLVPIDSGRGCVYDCSFCTIGRFWGRRSRPLPAARLADEIHAALALPGAKRAYLCHDLFGADREHALALCDALARRGAGASTPFEIRARVDHLDGELARALAAAGCYRVLLGIETADAGLRNAHGKRMREALDVRARLADIAAAGITPILSLILGLPGESEAGLRRTLDLALHASLAAGVHLSFHLVNPQPGCALGETHGAASRPVEDLPPDMALGAGLTRAERELIARHPDLCSTFAVLTGEPGGVEHLRFLARLSESLARRLERTPRTFAALAGELGLDTLDTFRALESGGASFDGAVRARGSALLDSLLAWENGQLRASVRGAPDQPLGGGPRALAEVVRAPVDVLAFTARQRAWSAGEPLPDAPPADVALAVGRGPRGVRTLRISAAVAEVLERCDGRDTTAVGASHAVLERLAAEGLVALPAGTAAYAERDGP